MDMNFDLSVANFLAHILDTPLNVSKLANTQNSQELMRRLLDKLVYQTVSNDPLSSEDTLQRIQKFYQSNDEGSDLKEIYTQLRESLEGKEWLAVLIPSGSDPVLDGIICDPELMAYLVKGTTKRKGLILQLDRYDNNIFAVLDVHPVIRTALNAVNVWPGVLIWSADGRESVFLPVFSTGFMDMDIEARIHWIFSRLEGGLSTGLGCLSVDYKKEFPEVYETIKTTIHILHLSDLHLGCRQSKRRKFHIEQFLRMLSDELGEGSDIIPVVTGDLLDSPSEQNFDEAKNFWLFMSGLGSYDPLVVLGNHDVRKDGQMNDNYQTAVDFPITKVVWFEAYKLGLICIDSVAEGELEQGSVSAAQLAEIDYELDHKANLSEYQLVVLMHHHPITHEIDQDKLSSFYQQLAGSLRQSSEAIKNSALLLDFIQKRSIAAVLHGHHHIPYLTMTSDNTVFSGCGSTSGIESEADGSVYLMANIVALTRVTGNVSSRIIAYRKPNCGISEPSFNQVIGKITPL